MLKLIPKDGGEGVGVAFAVCSIDFSCYQGLLEAFLQVHVLFEPRHERTCIQDFRPGPIQTGLWSHTIWLET